LKERAKVYWKDAESIRRQRKVRTKVNDIEKEAGKKEGVVYFIDSFEMSELNICV